MRYDGRYGFRWTLLLLAIFFVAPAIAHEDSNNKLVEFKRSGAWEIWCLDIGGSDKVLCDLNIVLNYKPRPDFRAMIPRVYWQENNMPLVKIDYERQTSFGKGVIQVPGQASFELNGCDRPCLLDGEQAADLIALLTDAESATLRFHDYVVQAFIIELDLDGFREGLRSLKEMQARFR